MTVDMGFSHLSGGALAVLSLILCSCQTKPLAPYSPPGKTDAASDATRVTAAPPNPTRQQTSSDCGIAALEHCAKLWEQPIPVELLEGKREQTSTLNDLKEIAERAGFTAFVLSALQNPGGPYADLAEHLDQERPLIILLRFPPSSGSLLKYIKEINKGGLTAPLTKTETANWIRHFVVLTRLEKDKTGAIKFQIMDPARRDHKWVTQKWLDLFWVNQEAKFLLISGG